MRTAPPWNRSSDGVIAARRKPTPVEVDTIIMGAVRRKYPAIVQSKGHRTYLFIRAALGGSGAADERNWCTRDLDGAERSYCRRGEQFSCEKQKSLIVLQQEQTRAHRAGRRLAFGVVPTAV